ncbi:MAG: amidohydrolase family protein, partial [Acetobacteraceae bacterium]|nr:amidohydrolase family protein [Acetobacteraceae bacterium]
MTVTVLERDADLGAQTQLGYVDCDVHLYPRNGGADFDPFLSERWRRHRRTIGGRARQALSGTAQYPRMSPEVGMRVDAWPPGGGIPGSDLDFVREQLLDTFGAAYGVVLPQVGRAADERNLEFGAAMSTAVNEWQAATWCDREPRLKASVQIPLEHQEAAIA